MRYELYLRSSDGPADLARRIGEALAADSDVERVGGSWEHTSDDGVVVVTPHPAGDPRWEGGEPEPEPEPQPKTGTSLGLDLSIAGGAGEALAAQLATVAFDWAERWSLEVYDPQLGRIVDSNDVEAITARVKQHADYLTDTVGLGDQATRYMDVDVAPTGMGLRTRFYIGLAAALLVLGLLANYCS